jgi:phosphoribosylformylglycinamidine synthase
VREGRKPLREYAGLAIPGGFSYGDDIASGVVLSNELTAFLEDELQSFIDDKKPVIGICNGFQVLVRTGLLPDRKLGTQSTSLTQNDVGHFINRWVDLEVAENVCAFTPPEAFDDLVPMQIAHGEGRFVVRSENLEDLFDDRQVVFMYRNNPNGSMADIAGICDPSGTVLGMMPHPERSVASMHEDRSRTPAAKAAAAVIFDNFVSYAREV